MALIMLLLPIILIIGLIEPKRILRWSIKPTRMQVFGWWSLFAFLYLIKFALLIQYSEYRTIPSGKDRYLLEDAVILPRKHEITNKWGYTYNEKVIIKQKYDDADHFSSGLARVKLNGTWGYIDKAGVEVTSFTYDSADNFNEDMAKVGINEKYGFIDKMGNQIIPLKYDNVGNFSNGLAKVEINEKYGLIDKTGREIIPVNYDYIGNFKNGLVPVKSNGKYGYQNKDGELVIPFEYDEAEDFIDGYAKVKLAENTGKVDTTGLFTLQSMKISLLEAVKNNYVRFSAHGNSIESSYINVENLTDMKLHLVIPAGTFLSANSSRYQNMVLTKPTDIVLEAHKTYSASVSTACMNIHRDIPGGDNTFAVSQRPDNHLLSKVVKLLNEGNYKYSVIQAAIWIVTDGASYSDVGILQNQFGQRTIDYDDYQKAASIVSEARKMK